MDPTIIKAIGWYLIRPERYVLPALFLSLAYNWCGCRRKGLIALSYDNTFELKAMLCSRCQLELYYCSGEKNAQSILISLS